MNHAATSVLRVVPDICIAYGVSDEYSFVFHRSTNLFERRAAKLVSTVVSSFTAAYCFGWREILCGSEAGDRDEHEGRDLVEDWLPTFDGRAVCYPSTRNLRDYLSWRQVDCHINNLYNTTFWSLVQGSPSRNVPPMSPLEAETFLRGTVSSDKHEILFSRFGINYNDEHEMFKKGSVVFRDFDVTTTPAIPGASQTENRETGNRRSDQRIEDEEEEVGEGEETMTSKTQQEKMRKARQKAKIVVRHADIIRDEFWDARPWILSGKVPV